MITWLEVWCKWRQLQEGFTPFRLERNTHSTSHAKWTKDILRVVCKRNQYSSPYPSRILINWTTLLSRVRMSGSGAWLEWVGGGKKANCSWAPTLSLFRKAEIYLEFEAVRRQRTQPKSQNLVSEDKVQRGTLLPSPSAVCYLRPKQ